MSENTFDRELALTNLRKRFPDREERIAWLRGYRRLLKRKQREDPTRTYPATLGGLDALLRALNSKEGE